ncbi:DNA adenine methylase [uncultured Bacteroides sp.]|uniref:DNA adenine methylase n=1 Tax=uncultured Bacteroides sp. TaxID=162156 RepID=UPI002606E92C|nr:DNA adenine methylase [uncultured Bacteroides sp.]
MKYTEIEGLDTFTLREAVATYGQEILPLWKEAVYSKPYKLESRRYIGCKAKLIDWIFDLIEHETQNVHTFCDIFAGTGSVSNRAVNLYNNVIINDFLYSNNVLYKAFFSTGDWNKEKIINLLDTFNSIDSNTIKDNYFSENYGNKYFDMASAKIIGYIRDVIEEIKPTLTEKEYCILIASLIYSIDRIANTLGHFEAYIKKEIKPRKFIMRLVDVKSFEGVTIYQEDANVLARNIHADIVYMDPPYNSRQYSRFYHVYEVLVKWDKPVLNGVARKPAEENMSDYCRVKAFSAFTDLVANIDAKYIVVSYNNTYKSKSSSSENKIKLEQIVEVLNKCGTTRVFTHKHQAFNAGKTEFDDHKEYLFITTVDNEKRNSSFATVLCRR